jgi:hypothetical protein
LPVGAQVAQFSSDDELLAKFDSITFDDSEDGNAIAGPSDLGASDNLDLSDTGSQTNGNVSVGILHQLAASSQRVQQIRDDMDALMFMLHRNKSCAFVIDVAPK